jgi:putative restriction endonuclease
MADRRNWTSIEVREALALYLVTDFGRFHSRNPDIMRLATRLDRTASAVALKLTNLAALDDSLPQKGMANASATDRAVWAEFLQNPLDVEAAYTRQTAPPLREVAEAPAQFDHLGGQTTRVIQARRGQALFRDMVLTSYKSRCALTGAEDPRILNASHILPWSDHPDHRMWPTNGICLNALHDRAFDRHLISFDADWRMMIAPQVPVETRRLLERVTDGRLRMPGRFQPDAGFMARHRARFQAGA